MDKERAEKLQWQDEIALHKEIEIERAKHEDSFFHK